MEKLQAWFQDAKNWVIAALTAAVAYLSGLLDLAKGFIG